MGKQKLEPEHFREAGGDLHRLQRQIVSGEVVVEDDASAVLSLGGNDRLRWLDSLVSQQVADLKIEETTEALLLSPQGRIEHSFLLTDDGHLTWLLTRKKEISALEDWLRSMVFRMEVSIQQPQGLVLFSSPVNANFKSLDPIVLFSDPWPKIGAESVGLKEQDHPGSGWSMLTALVEQDKKSSLAVPTVRPEFCEPLRIAAARPSMEEVDEKSIPHELDWLRTAVHLNKGCYRGQESVAKVHNLGQPPRRLTILHLDGSRSQLPEKGDEVLSDGDRVGRISRAGWHYELGPLALAVLKRNVPENQDLLVQCKEIKLAARQETIVPAGSRDKKDIFRLGPLR